VIIHAEKPLARSIHLRSSHSILPLGGPVVVDECELQSLAFRDLQNPKAAIRILMCSTAGEGRGQRTKIVGWTYITKKFVKLT